MGSWPSAERFENLNFSHPETVNRTPITIKWTARKELHFWQRQNYVDGFNGKNHSMSRTRWNFISFRQIISFKALLLDIRLFEQPNGIQSRGYKPDNALIRFSNNSQPMMIVNWWLRFSLSDTSKPNFVQISILLFASFTRLKNAQRDSSFQSIYWRSTDEWSFDHWRYWAVLWILVPSSRANLRSQSNIRPSRSFATLLKNPLNGFIWVG